MIELTTNQQKKFDENTPKNIGIDMVDMFRNEFGEKFLIYTILPFSKNGYFITGDEFDWEFGFLFIEERDMIINTLSVFRASNEELDSIHKIISKHKND